MSGTTLGDRAQGAIMGAFIGVIRNCVELDEKLTDTAWATAETCMWEAIRA